MRLVTLSGDEVVLGQSAGLLISDHVQPEAPLQFSVDGRAVVEFVDEISTRMVAFPGFDFISEYFLIVVVESGAESGSSIMRVRADLVESVEGVVDDLIAVHRYDCDIITNQVCTEHTREEVV
jgi:hypothetical protein